MSKTAYTLGRTKNYNMALAVQTEVYKLGQRLNEDPPYEGGWVWKTADGVRDFILNRIAEADPTWQARDFSVYQVELPTSWDVDVKQGEPGEYSILLNDAIIVGQAIRVEFHKDPVVILLDDPGCGDDCSLHGTAARKREGLS